MNLRTVALALASSSALVFASCAGYTLGSNKPAEFENISSIAIPTFKNDTLEPRIATLFTGETVKQFQNDGTYTISRVEDSDAVLRCTIVDTERRQARSARFNTLVSSELRVRTEVEYELIDNVTGIVLSKGTVSGDTNIFLDPNFQLTERQAFDEISREVAFDLISRLSEGWPGEEGNVGSYEEDEQRQLRRLRGEQDGSRGARLGEE